MRKATHRLPFPGETNYELAVVDRNSLRLDRGNVEGVRRQRFLLTGSYEAAVREGPALVQPVAGGERSIRPMEPEYGNAGRDGDPYLTPTISPTLDQTNTNPAGVRGVNRPAGSDRQPEFHRIRLPSNYFNLSAFAPTPAGSGQSGQRRRWNTGRSRDDRGERGIVSKSFVIQEGLRLRFEATFTNALNHTNFAPPATNVRQPEHVRSPAIRPNRGVRRKSDGAANFAADF